MKNISRFNVRNYFVVTAQTDRLIFRIGNGSMLKHVGHMGIQCCDVDISDGNE
jgi:hypothetical protein